MKSSHQIARELLSLPDMPMITNGCGSNEGMSLFVDGVHIVEQYGAIGLVTSDKYPMYIEKHEPDSPKSPQDS